MRYRFIFENSIDYPVGKMCKCMQVSRNAYYNWLKTKDVDPSGNTVEKLKQRIRELFELNKRIYGSTRIQKLLEREGLEYSRSYIALLMRKMGLRSIIKRKFVATTDSAHPFPFKENILERRFDTTVLGQKWVSDITYVRVGNDWNYLTTIIDLADRRVVGWSLSEDMKAKNTVVKAWAMARRNRGITAGFVFHSDRGIQYACGLTTKILGNNPKCRQSMGRKGDCWDNAVAESFFKTIKYEWIYRFKYESHQQCSVSIEQYIFWYNNERLHSSIGYRSPLEMEIYLRELNNKMVA